MQDFGTHCPGRGEEGVDGVPIGCGKGDVHLAGGRGVRCRDEPQRVPVDAEADVLAELLLAFAAERGEYGLVEGGAGRYVVHLDGDVIEHVPTSHGRGSRKAVEPNSPVPLPCSGPQSLCQGRAVVHQVRAPER